MGWARCHPCQPCEPIRASSKGNARVRTYTDRFFLYFSEESTQDKEKTALGRCRVARYMRSGVVFPCAGVAELSRRARFRIWWDTVTGPVRVQVPPPASSL
jgi:hypothetical protein